MTKDEALRLALEALESADWYIGQLEPFVYYSGNDGIHEERQKVQDAMPILKAALEAKNEPVAWISPSELLVMRGNALGGAKDWRVNVGLKPEDGDVGLYTTPPQRTWVGLTDEDKQKLAAEQHDWEGLCFAVEAKLKEKNT